ncbi:MAG: SDR family oxidoreductase [Candidatus Eremiobacteraeota bacterium]|nr:SDR family oxidoreductase [Candidatus Eremiobacteraeota bacterium]MBC5802309.1 SDR family oxidoreductase [Candidatus Eremiobacteraeota bacterium]MBC5820937.1 SDR family oxidoreductase [Candidatus Eremiobacteraeota bacterium]
MGRGIAVELASHGYRVAFTFRPAGTPPDETTRRICARGGAQSLAVAADHEREGETAAAIRNVESSLGGIDVLVHAVGPLVTHVFARASMEDYHRTLAGNLSSAVEAAFAVLPGMRERRFGRLVLFGMNGSHATVPARNLSLYAASKAAVVSFARTLALEEAHHGITVNAIEPGDIRDKDIDRATARSVAGKNPTGHAGSWEDVAAAVRFLIADEAGFINGVVLGVNGGLAAPYE